MNGNFESGQANAVRVRHKLNIRALYAAAAVIAVVVILVLCMTVFFNVSEVEVKGVTLYTEDQIINAGGIYEDMNLVRTDVSRAEKRLTDNLVYIDEVKVTKEYPSTVVIDCKQAEKAADIEYEGGYYVLSTSGKILEADNPAPTGGIPVITGFKFYVAQDLIDDGEELTEEDIFAYRDAGEKLRSEDGYSDKIIMDLLTELRKQKYKNVRSIDISSRANIIMNIDDRLDVKLGSSADIDYKLSYFSEVMNRLAEGYEGTLIYNGSENGVSAIPKEQYLGKVNMGKDPEKTDESSAEKPDSGAAEPADAPVDTDSSQSDGGTNGNGGNNAENGGAAGSADNGSGWDNGGWSDNTYNNGGGYDNGGWSDNTYDNGGGYDNGGWSDNTYDNGGGYDNGGWSDNTYNYGGGWDNGNYGW